LPKAVPWAGCRSSWCGDACEILGGLGAGYVREGFVYSCMYGEKDLRTFDENILAART